MKNWGQRKEKQSQPKHLFHLAWTTAFWQASLHPSLFHLIHLPHSSHVEIIQAYGIPLIAFHLTGNKHLSHDHSFQDPMSSGPLLQLRQHLLARCPSTHNFPWIVQASWRLGAFALSVFSLTRLSSPRYAHLFAAWLLRESFSDNSNRNVNLSLHIPFSSFMLPFRYSQLNFTLLNTDYLHINGNVILLLYTVNLSHIMTLPSAYTPH